MGYPMTGSDGESYHMGCLADVREVFCEEDDVEYVDVNLEHELNCLKISPSIREAGLLIPDYKGTTLPNEVRINREDPASFIHSLLTPYRIFAEMQGSAEFFQMNKQHGAMGAFIACHTAALDSLGTDIQGKPMFFTTEGWHQSMFCSFSITRLLDEASIRRVAALYPELRQLLGGDDAIKNSFVVGYLPNTLESKVKDALTAAGLRQASTLDLNTQSQQVVERCQLWHDVIYNTLKKEIS